MNRTTILPSLLFLALLQPYSLRGDDRVQYMGHHEPDFFAELLDVEAQGDTVYVTGVSGLSLFDVEDPSNPVLVGRYEPIGDPYVRFYQSSVGGGIAFCAGRSDGIFSIDLERPPDPKLLNQYQDTGVAFEGVTLVDTILYAAAREHGIRIFDITDPGSPVQIGELEGLVATWRLDVVPPFAYAADGAGGLKVIDITDPTAPACVGSLATSGTAQDIAVQGTHAFLAVGGSGMDVVDISSPSEPAFLANFDTPGSTIGIAVQDSLAFLSDWDGVQVVRITDPGNPVAAGWEDTPSRAMGIDAAGIMHYVADWFTFRIYRYGPTDDPDIHLPVDDVNLGNVEVGELVDTLVSLVNTGGDTLVVTGITSSNIDFSIQPHSFTVAPSDTQQLVVTFYRSFESSTSTVFTIPSNDPDESSRTLSVEIIDDSLLQEGEPAPDFTLNDLDGLPHSLSDYQGKVVLLAFFASW